MFFKSSEKEINDTDQSTFLDDSDCVAVDRCAFRDSAWIDDKVYHIGLFRKPEGKSPEHAFIVVQGRTASTPSRAFFKRYDLVVDQENEGKSLILYKAYLPDGQDEKSIQESFYETVLKGDKVYAISWNISAVASKKLHNAIMADKKNPPNYSLSGYRSTANSSRSETNKGHNCFSFARHHLLAVQPKVKAQLDYSWTDIIAEKTSWYVVKAPEEKTGICCIV